MNLIRFAEQTELKNIYDQYVTAFESQNPSHSSLPSYNDFYVNVSNDGSGVYFTPEATLFGEKSKRIQEGSIAKCIGHRLMDCAAYFLAQNTPIDKIPETLRICLCICHENVHWTGAIATINSFKQSYTELLEYYHNQNSENTREIISLDGRSLGKDREITERILFNRAKNLIYKKLDVILEKPLQGEKITPEEEKVKRALDFFQKSTIQIKHYDSMNIDHQFAYSYHARVKESLTLIEQKIDFYPIKCSQQHSNTCGDHTAVNLFMESMMNTLPIINDPSRNEITSAKLRELTDSLPNNRNHAANKAKIIISSLSSSTHVSTDNTTPDTCKRLYTLANSTYNLIIELYSLCSTTTTAIVHLARRQANHGPQSNHIKIASDITITAKQKIIFDKLVDIFSGKSKLFTELHFRDENKLTFGLFMMMVAIDHCAEIEHFHLVAAKTSDALKEQHTIIENYKKTVLAKNQTNLPVNNLLTSHLNLQALPNTILQWFSPPSAAEKLVNDILGEYHAAVNPSELVLRRIKAINEFKKDSSNMGVIPINIMQTLTRSQVKGILFLFQFQYEKKIAAHEITDSNEKNIYLNNINLFYTKSLDIWFSNESEDNKLAAMKKEAFTHFAHTYWGTRLLADALMVIGFIFFGLGALVGYDRLRNGKTFFFSSNSLVKKLENEVIGEIKNCTKYDNNSLTIL